MNRILGLEGADPRILGLYFKAVVQAVDFRVRDVGPDPLYGEGPGQLPAQGRATDHREAAEAVWGRDMGVSSAGGSNEGSGF